MANPQDTNPARRFVAVTLSNTVNFTEVPRAIYIGGTGGNLVAIGPDDLPVTFTGLVAGTILPIQPKRINVTSTTATDLVALY